MQKVILALLALAVSGWGAISSLTIPHEIDSAAIPKVIYIDQNNDSIVNKVNELKDTVNLYLPGSGGFTGSFLSNLASLRATIDSDNNSTAEAFYVTRNGSTDTIFKVPENLATSARLWGHLTLDSNLTARKVSAADSVVGAHLKTVSGNLIVGGTANVSGVATIGSGGGLTLQYMADTRIPYASTGGSLTATSNLTYTAGTTTFASANGTFSGTLGVTGNTGIGVTAGSDRLRITTATSDDGLVLHDGTNTLAQLIKNSSASSGRLILRSSGTAFANFETGTSSLTSSSFAFTVDDNLATAWEVQQGANDYLRVTTTNSSEAVTFGNASTNPSYSFLGSGTLTVGGAVAVTGAATAATIALGGNEAFTYDEGTFTITATGFSGSVTSTARYVRVGKAVTLHIPAMTGTSNANTFTFTGLPAAIQPATTQLILVNVVENNGSFPAIGSCYAEFAVGSGTVTLILNGNPSGWTASGTKSHYQSSVYNYLLN